MINISAKEARKKTDERDISQKISDDYDHISHCINSEIDLAIKQKKYKIVISTDGLREEASDRIIKELKENGYYIGFILDLDNLEINW